MRRQALAGLWMAFTCYAALVVLLVVALYTLFNLDGLLLFETALEILREIGEG